MPEPSLVSPVYSREMNLTTQVVEGFVSEPHGAAGGPNRLVRYGSARHRYIANASRPVAGLMHPASCLLSRKRKTLASTKREEENVHVGNEYATDRP